jgi:predicted transcriptional regulator
MKKEADEYLAGELAVYTENDGDLYRQQYQPQVLNLARKRYKGIYDEKLAIKLVVYLIESGLKKYRKEFGFTSPVNRATKELAASEVLLGMQDEINQKVREIAEKTRKPTKAKTTSLLHPIKTDEKGKPLALKKGASETPIRPVVTGRIEGAPFPFVVAMTDNSGRGTPPLRFDTEEDANRAVDRREYRWTNAYITHKGRLIREVHGEWEPELTKVARENLAAQKAELKRSDIPLANSLVVLKRDGVEAGRFATENDALEWLHKREPYSWEHAFKYEGWSMAREGDPIVKSVTIIRAEGPHALCGVPHTSPSFAEASRWLRSQAHTFPQTGGYDKHDLTVVFYDGETYYGRLDCKALNQPDNDLDVKKHMIDFLSYVVKTFPEHEAKEAERYLEKYVRLAV